MRHRLSPRAESSYNWPLNRASKSTRQREPFMSHEPSTPTSPSAAAPRAELPKTQPMQHGRRPATSAQVPATLVPETGWHFLHLFYRIDRERLRGFTDQDR